MEVFRRLNRFLHFYRNARTVYRVHSPALHTLVHALFDPGHQTPPGLRDARLRFYKDHSPVPTVDMGAGRPRNHFQIELRDIARRSSVSERQSNLLYRLSYHLQPKVVLELGTCLGLSAGALQAGCRTAAVTTIEGNPHLAERARSLFSQLHWEQIPTVHTGPFANVLPRALQAIHPIDLVFIDGDHTFEGTKTYVTSILPYLKQAGVLAIHDINWSRDMQLAWQWCKSLDAVTQSIDLYEIGILLTDRSFVNKRHLKIVPYWMKPWQLGVFN